MVSDKIEKTKNGSKQLKCQWNVSKLCEKRLEGMELHLNHPYLWLKLGHIAIIHTYQKRIWTPLTLIHSFLPILQILNLKWLNNFSIKEKASSDNRLETWSSLMFLGCAALLLAQPHHHVIFVVFLFLFFLFFLLFSTFCNKCKLCMIVTALLVVAASVP